MRLLLTAALHGRRHFVLILCVIITLFGLTLSSQLEMFALGVITGKSKEMTTAGEAKSKNPLKAVIAKLTPHFPYISHRFEMLLAMLLTIACIKAGFLFASRFVTQLFAIRIARDLRQKYFEHLQTLPMSFYQKYNIGALSSRVVGDASQIATSFNSWITNYFHTPFTVVLSLVFCFYVSWPLSLVIFVGLPAVVLPIVFLAKRVKKMTRQLQKNQERFASVLIDFLAGIHTVKIFAMEPFSLKKYQEQNEQMAKLEAKAAKYDLMTRPILHLITTLCLTSVLLFGLYILHLELSELIVFCGLLYLFYEPIKRFADENANIQKGVVAAERLFEVLKIEPEIQDHPDALPISTFKDAITFDKVWFRYDDTWILKDVSFSVKRGETIAIVGATGAGKSTIVQLLPRLYEVQKGQILIDGKPLDTYVSQSLRDLISYVAQKPFLFYDTIAANIAYGRDYTLEEVIQAAKKAHADEFIDTLPDGYTTHLSEMGKNLSGGQQQRLALARALIKKAPILVLDEATSSLDALSEHRIQTTIRQLHGEVTQILIAHRLTTIQHADRIIYLEKGEKIAEGTREELLETCPAFRLMWETHFLNGGASPNTPAKELSPFAKP